MKDIFAIIGGIIFASFGLIFLKNFVEDFNDERYSSSLICLFWAILLISPIIIVIKFSWPTLVLILIFALLFFYNKHC